MMKTVRGVYDGTTFVFDEDIRLDAGQEVLVTLLNKKAHGNNAPRRPIYFSQFVGLGEKMFSSDAQEYIREMRDNDRI